MPRPRRRVARGTGVLLALASAAAVGLAGASGLTPTRIPGVNRAGRVAGISIWPEPVRAHRGAVVEIADRRGAARPTGVTECLTPPGGQSRCRAVAGRLEPGGRRTAVGLRLGRVGRWRLELRAAGPLPLPPGALDASRTITVAAGHVRLLATGDSEIQGIDEMLAGGLPAVRVTSEAHISTGISKPQMFDWVARAAAQAASGHPDITVVFIGANDGFALPARSGGEVNCCGAAWIAAFAGRTRAMMASYLRGGAGRVYWLTLPAPRDGAAAAVFRAVNQAYAAAAASLPAGVHLVDIRPVFTPGGRYRDSMVYQGRRVTVREPDGYHLSVAGNRIATAILIGAMRSDGLLG